MEVSSTSRAGPAAFAASQRLFLHGMRKAGRERWIPLGDGARRTTSVEALSLDVFDTSLTRAVLPPSSLYLLLGRYLEQRNLLSCTPEVFARLRAEVESVVWHREGGLDAPVRIEHFYEELARRLELGPGLIGRFVEAELQLESRLLRPVPDTRRLLEDHVRITTPVAFVSDTYFDAGFIKDQLRRHGILPDESTVIASSDFHTSKASAGLFEVALEELGVSPSALLHVGDNPLSDVESARRNGIRTWEFVGGRANRFEVLLSERMWATGGMTAALAGASRLARLHTSAADGRMAAIRDVAAGVAAPFLVAYVLWLLHRAEELGLRRLYFIARDGQVMTSVASQLAQRMGMEVDVAYLFASRQSVNLAATFDLSEAEVAWVERDLPFLTPADVVSRFDVSWDEVSVSMSQRGIARDQPPGSEGSRRALAAIRDVAELRDLVLSRAADRRQLVGAYLEQEGLLEGTACGLVDFGGVGSQMRSLHALMTHLGDQRPHIFLVGLDRLPEGGFEPSNQPRWLEDTETYLYDHRRGQGIKRARGFGTCVQMFCAADHGTVTGYARDGDRVEPTLAAETDDALIQWGLPTLRRTITSFVEHVVLDNELVDVRADLREPVTAVIDLFWSEPTPDTARAWGAFPFEGAEVGATTRGPLAYRYTWKRVLNSVVRRSFPNLGWTHWFEGSLQLSSPLVRAPLHTMLRIYHRWERGQGLLAQRAWAAVRWLVGRPREAGRRQRKPPRRHVAASDEARSGDSRHHPQPTLGER